MNKIREAFGVAGVIIGYVIGFLAIALIVFTFQRGIYSILGIDTDDDTEEPMTFTEDQIEYDDESMALAYFTKDGETYHLFRQCPQIKDEDVHQMRMYDLSEMGYSPCEECSKQIVDFYN